MNDGQCRKIKLSGNLGKYNGQTREIRISVNLWKRWSLAEIKISVHLCKENGHWKDTQFFLNLSAQCVILTDVILKLM